MSKLSLIPIICMLGLFLNCNAFAKYFELTSSAVAELISQQPSNTIILDVRTAREYEAGHIKGAKLIDFYQLHFEVELKKLDRHANYIIYCLAGIRSQKAYNLMKKLGFSNLYIMPSGIYDWRDKNLPLVVGKLPEGN